MSYHHDPELCGCENDWMWCPLNPGATEVEPYAWVKAAAATPTEGPWEVVEHSHVDGELWLSVNQHADGDGMKEWIAEIKYLTTDEARQRANARLIAAAPDLLAALIDVCRMIEIGWIPPDDVDEIKPEGAWESACAAYRDSHVYSEARALIGKVERPPAEGDNGTTEDHERSSR